MDSSQVVIEQYLDPADLVPDGLFNEETGYPSVDFPSDHFCIAYQVLVKWVIYYIISKWLIILRVIPRKFLNIKINNPMIEWNTHIYTFFNIYILIIIYQLSLKIDILL